ncbi:MAG: hypothetical protein ACRDG9_13785 [Actinomycetota bacterium]
MPGNPQRQSLPTDFEFDGELTKAGVGQAATKGVEEGERLLGEQPLVEQHDSGVVAGESHHDVAGNVDASQATGGDLPDRHLAVRARDLDFGALEEVSF